MADLVDDIDAKECPKCHGLMIKQEIDASWMCENCQKPHGKEKPKDEDAINYRKCANCGRDSGIFKYCIDCRPKE